MSSPMSSPMSSFMSSFTSSSTASSPSYIPPHKRPSNSKLAAESAFDWIQKTHGERLSSPGQSVSISGEAMRQLKFFFKTPEAFEKNINNLASRVFSEYGANSFSVQRDRCCRVVEILFK